MTWWILISFQVLSSKSVDELVRFSPDGRVRLAGARLSSKAVIGPSPLPPPASPPERIPAAAGSIARIQPLRDDAFKAKLARMAKHHVARLQVNDHIAEAVSGRSKDWIKMKNPAAREMVVKKAEKTRTHFIFRIEHLAALGTFASPDPILVTSDGLAVDDAGPRT